MKTGLPDGHDLPESFLNSSIVHRDILGDVELTDVQYEALKAGVARGKHILAVAPTSSGKTGVGLFAAGAWLDRGLADGAKVVFLTSHRALARQKFMELKSDFAPLFTLAPSEIVLATGDDVVNADGDPAEDAFSAPVLVATYEKYLNMVAGAGVDSGGSSKVCVIADEIQLIGDASRGQNVEILMTLIRRRAGQIVGLSAVLEDRYATLLADWLGARLIVTRNREVELIYELRTPKLTLVTSTRAEGRPEERPARTLGTIETLRELLTASESHEPIAVFCMSKKQVFQLSEEWAAEAARLGARTDDVPSFREPTTSSEELERYLPHRFAYHTADLNEDERIAVETRLGRNSLKVVFATTTLAAGLNYSFKTVIIHAWKRWKSTERVWEPIPRGDFHNMAGRAGRLSHVDTAGRVIYFAEDAQELRAAPRYLSWWELDEFAPRIDPGAFPQLSLQLLASNVVSSEDALCRFLQSTFSAERELELNARQPEVWAEAVHASVAELAEWRFLA